MAVPAGSSGSPAVIGSPSESELVRSSVPEVPSSVLLPAVGVAVAADVGSSVPAPDAAEGPAEPLFAQPTRSERIRIAQISAKLRLRLDCFSFIVCTSSRLRVFCFYDVSAFFRFHENPALRSVLMRKPSFNLDFPF